MDKLVEVDAQYREWISEVSKRFHQSQIKAAVKVNDEMLRFYWQLGKELHDRKDKFSYGQSFYKTISQIFPKLGKISEAKKLSRFLQFRGDIIRLLLISAMEIRKKHCSL